MSFLSFLSSHRLHSSHRPWIEPLNVRFDIIAHEHPSGEESAGDLSPASASELSFGLLPDEVSRAAADVPPAS